MKDNMLEKKCSGCKLIKNVKEFYINRSSKDGYRNECKGCNKKWSKKWREENKIKEKERNKKWREENKEKRKQYNKEYKKNRRSKDPLYKLSNNMRNSINKSLKDGGYTKNTKSNKIIGCSYEELLDHLNDNEYGFVYSDVDLDIDHIVPLSKATNKDEILKLNKYTNLQLLPKSYNRYIKRDNDFDKEDFEKWLEKK